MTWKVELEPSTEHELLQNRILHALALAAQRLAVDRAQALQKLREAAALLWRLQPTSRPLTPLELEEQIYTPLEIWLQEDVRAGFSGPLSIANVPTSMCLEIMFETDPANSWEKVQSIIRTVRNICKLSPSGQMIYEKFRRYIIEHPLIPSDSEISDLLVPLGISFHDLYQKIPPHLVKNERVYPCPSCGWPMAIQTEPVKCGAFWCWDKIGRHEWVGRRLMNTGTAQAVEGHLFTNQYMLHPAIWKFTLIPGLLELSVANRLEQLGYPTQLWPHYDRADVATIILGETVNIDAKVWSSSFLLASHLASMPVGDPCMIVIPDSKSGDLNFLRQKAPARFRVETETSFFRSLPTCIKA